MSLFKWYAYYLLRKANQARLSGDYSADTLRLGQSAFHICPSPQNAIALLRLRRDFGRKPCYRLIKLLMSQLPQLSFNHQRQALSLAVEYFLSGKRSRLSADLFNKDTLSVDVRVSLKQVLPTINTPSSAFLCNQLGIEHGTPQLAQIYESQGLWREQFCEYLKGLTENVGIVGNGGILKHESPDMSSWSCVVRFNHFLGSTASVDTRCDVWVTNPSYSEIPPSIKTTRWVIMSGPEVHYSAQNWASIEPFLLAEIPVLTVPIEVWRELVSIIKAPPSAGALLACWLEYILSAEKIGLAGFNALSGESKKLDYHASQHGRDSGRHDWSAEGHWLRELFDQ